ncbi:NADH dehydrogenase I subunit H [Profundibacterium mesophilum KAUST100406-0324]|uniref:NADH-quinone oxidoreductase subunit H n=1 Tax=Profundibacterium mesophilum KAUST100406-0324 TaxID=1037889 RepID=A0A921NSU9_9RHOB|nr:NADH dehydrogenase I subunit H [Profundibacterium mesophilum KAUST100406-0324]
MAEFFTQTNTGIALLTLGQALLVTVMLLVSMAFLLYADRKVWAAVQMRRGPNVVGIFGLLQSFADFLKYILKEIVVPAGADRTVFFLAPIAAFTLPLILWAVMPFNDGWVLADLNVAILYIFAISSLEVYGVIMGGWASNSKYPFLGSLRSAAQMISYEVSIGLILVGVILSTGSLNLSQIVHAQDGGWGLFSWYWLPHFPMVFLFFISALAETNRPPFDLPEAESELVAGYQVEYSSTPFLLFMIGEYTAIVFLCALMVILFFGGWLSPLPFLPDGILWMMIKMLVIFFLFALVKAVVPRYRYDQLMRLGWKVFLPFSLAWVVLVAFLAHFGLFGGAYARWDDTTILPECAEARADFVAPLGTDDRAALLEDDSVITNRPAPGAFVPVADAYDGAAEAMERALAGGWAIPQEAAARFAALDTLVLCAGAGSGTTPRHDEFRAAHPAPARDALLNRVLERAAR